MLQRNFGSQWLEAEFPAPPKGMHSNFPLVENFLRDRPDIQAFSSHTAQLPLPDLGREIFPVVFLRHPLDRLKSAYAFERIQDSRTHGAQLAKRHDFAGYVHELLANANFRQARNFQTQRLAANEPPDQGSERERALRTFDALPFVGLVEAYERSVERLGALLAPHFPRLQAIALHENKTASQTGSLEERIAAMKAAMPADLFDRLVECNSDDFAIYERAKSLYEDPVATQQRNSTSAPALDEGEPPEAAAGCS